MGTNNVERVIVFLGALGVGTMLFLGNMMHEGYKKKEDIPQIERTVAAFGIYAIGDFLDTNDDGTVKSDEINKFYNYMNLNPKERSLESITAEEWYSYLKHTGRRIVSEKNNY